MSVDQPCDLPSVPREGERLSKCGRFGRSQTRLRRALHATPTAPRMSAYWFLGHKARLGLLSGSWQLGISTQRPCTQPVTRVNLYQIRSLLSESLTAEYIAMVLLPSYHMPYEAAGKGGPKRLEYALDSTVTEEPDVCST